MKKILSILLVMVLFFAILPTDTASAAVKISKVKATLEVDATIKLKISGTSSHATWKSSRASIAKVSNNGTVTAIYSGAATITATVGSKKYTCVVTVVDNSGPYYIEKTLYVGDRFQGYGSGFRYISDESIMKYEGDSYYVATKAGEVYLSMVSSSGYLADFIFTVKSRLTAEVYDKTLRTEDYVSINFKDFDTIEGEIRYEEIGDNITCYWGERDGDTTPLWFSLNKPGTASVIVTAYYGDGITESITINVTVPE